MKYQAKFGLFKGVCFIPKLFLVRCFGFFSCITVMAGCTLTPQGNRYIIESSQATKVVSTVFTHQIFYKEGVGNTLFIFIHGDGVPWLGKNLVATDPTPYYSLTWSLFERTHAHALFITRPCYFGLSKPAICEPKYWTYARYSKDIIGSMHQALKKYLTLNPMLDEKTKILVGYSGGGAIAVHLANGELNVAKLITLAGNLDHPRWTAYHGYSPLVASLNAADIKVAPSVIQQHFIGAKDKNITVDINKRFYEKNYIKPIVLDGYGHQCCWARDWEALENTILKAAF